MINIDENIIELRKYFKKLIQALDNEVVFNFGNKKLVKKPRIDDLICCIESMYPAEIKKLYQRVPNKLKGYKAFVQLSKSIRTPFFWNKDLYVINHNEVSNQVQLVLANLNSDFKHLYND